MAENEKKESGGSVQENFMKTMDSLVSSYNPPTVKDWIDAGKETMSYIKDSEQLMVSRGNPQVYGTIKSRKTHADMADRTFDLFEKGLNDLYEMEETEEYAKNFRTMVLNNGRMETY